jgi:hypothetical protein
VKKCGFEAFPLNVLAFDGAGGGGSGGTGAEAQWLFLPEPDTRKTVRN